MEYMDFTRLALTPADRRALKTSVNTSVSVESCQRLLRYHLVEEERQPIPGYAPKPLGTCRATELGRDYLVCWNDQRRIRRKESLRYWITTCIAVAALIMSLFR